jgi:hypothetical protein
VHAVSLGWVTATILGALYLVGPMAFRMPVPARVIDRVGFALFAGGATGLLIAFAAGRPAGAPIAAGLVALGVAPVLARFAGGLAGAPVSRAVRTFVGLSFANLSVALVAGGWLGATLDGRAAGPPVRLLTVHLVFALGGWLAMLAIGVGLRLVPMLLPSGMPESGRGLLAAWLAEAGLVSLALGPPASAWRFTGSALLAAGAGLVLSEVASMLTDPKPRARGLPRPDWGIVLAAAALVALVGATAGAVHWSVGPVEPAVPAGSSLVARLAVAAGLLFPTLLILGVGFRLLPLYAWLRAAKRWGVPEGSHPPHGWASMPAQAGAALAGLSGASLLLTGLAIGSPAALRGAGVAWTAAAVLSAGHHLVVLRRARREFDPTV